MSDFNNETVIIDGSTYKIGLHGRPFILIDDEWYRSQKSVLEVKRGLAGRIRVSHESNSRRTQSM